jgi:hypothetical protein
MQALATPASSPDDAGHVVLRGTSVGDCGYTVTLRCGRDLLRGFFEGPALCRASW